MSGNKNTTWRVDDEKNISLGDTLSLCTISGEEFTQAKVLSTHMKTFGSLDENKIGKDMRDFLALKKCMKPIVSITQHTYKQKHK